MTAYGYYSRFIYGFPIREFGGFVRVLGPMLIAARGQFDVDLINI